MADFNVPKTLNAGTTRLTGTYAMQHASAILEMLNSLDPLKHPQLFSYCHQNRFLGLVWHGKIWLQIL